MYKRAIIFCILVLCFSCKKSYPDYDDIPAVDFVSAAVFSDSSDYTVKFTFTLHDGDGNFGLSEEDTVSPYIDDFQQNFVATAHAIDDGDTNTLPYNFSYRIPRLREEGDNKFIKADVTIDFTLTKSVFSYDSVFFTYFVYDRDLNKSNIDTTNVIVF